MLSDNTTVPILWLFGLGGGVLTVFLTFVVFFLKGIKTDFHEMSQSIGELNKSVAILLTKDSAKDREIKEMKQDLRILWTKLDLQSVQD